jgi:hypothetical protein
MPADDDISNTPDTKNSEDTRDTRDTNDTKHTNDGTNSNDPVSGAGAANNTLSAANADTEVLGSAAPHTFAADAAPPAPGQGAEVAPPAPAPGPTPAPGADAATAVAAPAGAVPPARTASGKVRRRITVATLSLAGVIVLAGIFGTGVLLGTHLGNGQPSQRQMQSGPGGGFTPGGQAPAQDGTGTDSGTRPGTDIGTDPGTGSGTDSGSTEGS